MKISSLCRLNVVLQVCRTSALLGIVAFCVIVGVAQDKVVTQDSKTPVSGKFRKPTTDFKMIVFKERSISESDNKTDLRDATLRETRSGDEQVEQQDEQKAQPENNGTNPTLLISSLQISSEFISLRQGRYNNTLKVRYTKPFGKNLTNSVKFTLPLVNTNVLRNNQLGIGDIGVQFTNVAKVTKKYGIVFQGEMVFATANRPELGTGKNVIKGTFVYALFLKGGNIFAPSVVQSNSLWGKRDRPNVNNTTIDFYIVPKLKDPKTFVTLDPALVLDWGSGKQYGSLAVTTGRSVGKLFGGALQIYGKPSILFGGERTGNWGVEIGLKILGL